MEKKNIWTRGLAALSLAGALMTAPFCVLAAEKMPEGISAGGMSLEGMTVEEAETAVSDYVGEKLSQDIVFVISGEEVRTGADELGLSWGNQETFAQELKEAAPSGNLIRRYMKTKDLHMEPLNLDLEMSVDQEKAAAFVSEKCGSLMTQATDASITRENGEFVITPSQTGVTVDLEATRAALNEAVNQEGTGEIRVEAAVTEQEPAITTEDLSTIQDVLGTFSTDFSSSGASRSTNLRVGAAKINGRVLMPGEILSGYECMQPFTVANGYRAATAYENGRSVDSIGGGVCQISTTLYNAALLAELEIVQRQNHSMTVAYVKPSMDAAIAGTYKDLKIKNSYDTPIYVEGTAEGRTLTFTIYGKETRPANRTISFESETLQTIDPGAPTEQVDASLAPGQRVRVQSSHTGLKSRLFKCVYVDGELTERTLLHNDTYNASKAIYRVGPAVPAVVEPMEPSPEETTPAETTPVETAPAETVPEPAPGYEFGPGMVTAPGTAPAGSQTAAQPDAASSSSGPAAAQPGDSQGTAGPSAGPGGAVSQAPAQVAPVTPGA